MSHDTGLEPSPKSAKDLIKKPLRWFALETIGNFLYDQLGALWRSAVMTALLTLALRFYSTIPLDVRLIIGLFIFALIFFTIDRWKRHKTAPPSPLAPHADALVRVEENREPEPNIVCVEATTDWVGMDQHGTFRERLSRNGGISFLAIFANEANDDRPIGSIGSVMAQITFYHPDGRRFYYVHSGAWLNEDFNVTDFDKGSRRKLLIAAKLKENGFKIITDNHESEDRYLPPTEDQFDSPSQLKVHVHLLTLEDRKFSVDAYFNLLCGQPYGIRILKQPPSSTTDNPPDCQDEWLHRIAEYDRQEINRVVRVVGTEVALDLESEMPNAKFRLKTFNASVYPVFIEPKASGNIWHNNKKLKGGITIKVWWSEGVIERGRLADVVIIQSLTDDDCKSITEDPNPNDSEFNLEQIVITISGFDALQNVVPKPLDIPFKAIRRDGTPVKSRP